MDHFQITLCVEGEMQFSSGRREVTLGIYFACRGKPASTKPADSAIKTAKLIKAGKFKLPGSPKKSNK